MKPEVTLGDFARLDLRIGTILEAKKIEGSDKLLVLNVGLGRECDPDRGEVFECRRVLVAGIGEDYAPAELGGRQVVVLLNIEPKVIRGVVSEGMLLAVDVEGRPVLIAPDREAPDGSVVR